MASVSNSGEQFSTAATAAAMSIAGKNGTLVIEDIPLIVSEIELERADGARVSAGEDDDCEEFEGGPFLVNLLDGSADQVVNALIPAGSYTEFEFEVENLDAALPVLDGHRATEILKADPATAHIPVIAIAVHTFEADRLRADAAGCDSFLAEPWRPMRLVQEVQRMLPDA